jgi:hypothetical protein
VDSVARSIPGAIRLGCYCGAGALVNERGLALGWATLCGADGNVAFITGEQLDLPYATSDAATMRWG